MTGVGRSTASTPITPERLAFDVETEVGKASRWNTLRALRVLDWARG